MFSENAFRVKCCLLFIHQTHLSAFSYSLEAQSHKLFLGIILSQMETNEQNKTVMNKVMNKVEFRAMQTSNTLIQPCKQLF